MDKTVRLRAGAAGGAAGAAGGAAGAEGGAAGAAGTAGTAGTEGSAAPKVAEPNALPEFPSPVIAYKVQVNEGVLEAVAASTGRCQDFCVNGFRFLFLSLFSFQ